MTLLSKDEQKTIRKNLREYSRVFDQEDQERIAGADQEVVERRRELLSRWHAWREMVEEDMREEREELGLPQDPVEELLRAKTEELVAGEEPEEKVIEEIVEEVLEETEEVVQ